VCRAAQTNRISAPLAPACFLFACQIRSFQRSPTLHCPLAEGPIFSLSLSVSVSTLTHRPAPLPAARSVAGRRELSLVVLFSLREELDGHLGWLIRGGSGSSLVKFGLRVLGAHFQMDLLIVRANYQQQSGSNLCSGVWNEAVLLCIASRRLCVFGPTVCSAPICLPCRARAERRLARNAVQCSADARTQKQRGQVGRLCLGPAQGALLEPARRGDKF